MSNTQQRRKQTKKAQQRHHKAPTASFWAERAAKIAASRAKNEKSGMTERERRAQRKADRAKEAAKAAKKGTKTPAPTKTTKPPKTTPAPAARTRSDVSSGAYIARVLKSIAKTTPKNQRDYVSRYIGADGGAGWVIVGTDGHRALLQIGKVTNDAMIKQPLVTAEGPAFHFDLTADVEHALRALDAETLTLTIDAKRHLLTVIGTTDVPAVSGPIAGTRTLKSATFILNRRYLLDGLGRGGRLRYDAKPDRVLIETPDALRYVVMVVKPPQVPPAAPRPKTTKPAKPATRATKTKTTTETTSQGTQQAAATLPPAATSTTTTTTSTDPLGAAQ